MQGKVVMVTGAFGALGRVVAEQALARGAKVAAVDYAPGPAKAFDGDCLVIGGVDLADAAAAQGAVDQALARFGRLDGLINIAGGFVWQTTAEGDPAAWERMHRLNVLTVLGACRAALPSLKASGAGRIVNTGALGAVKAAAGMGAYAAAKAGVHRLTEALAEELKGQGVTVNAVLPSIIDTPANRADMPDADPAKWASPAEVAEAMLFLAGEGAGGITGALLPVTGRV